MRTQHEEWAETEAEFCDLMVETLMSTAKDWHAKELFLYGEDNAKMVMVCVIKAQAYKQMADSLRRPYRTRLAREATDGA